MGYIFHYPYCVLYLYRPNRPNLTKVITIKTIMITKMLTVSIQSVALSLSWREHACYANGLKGADIVLWQYSWGRLWQTIPRYPNTKEMLFLSMMTSWRGYAFRITGPPWGEYTFERPVLRSFDILFAVGLTKWQLIYFCLIKIIPCKAELIYTSV